MSNILVTGGAGFIPSSLVDALLAEGHTVFSVDNFITGNQKNISNHKKLFFHEADVNSYEEIAPIFIENKIDFVFHYAALVGVERTLGNPVKVLEDFNGFQNIFNLSRDSNIKKIFFSSSSEVYGEPVHLPQKEYSTPLNSRLPYAVMKDIGECFCKSFQQEYDMDYTVFRFFNTYGPRQSKDFVVSKFLHAAKNGKDLTIYGDGSQTRTLCYIEDHIQATMRAFNENLYNNEIVNIGNDKEVTILQLAELIIELFNSKSKIIFLEPLKEGDMTRRQPDVTKMRKLLGREFTELEVGLKKAFLNNDLI